MSNVGRILTLVIEIKDDEESKWIWDCHLGKTMNGIQVFCVGEGDLVKEIEHE